MVRRVKGTLPEQPVTESHHAADGAEAAALAPSIDGIADDDALPSGDCASLALSRIERLVDSLSMAVERGDIRADAVFEGRVRVVADRLLALVAGEDRNRAVN